MTILELQKRLQEMYEKYGDVEVRHQCGDIGDYCSISCVTKDGGDIVIRGVMMDFVQSRLAQVAT